tara:strand:- start:43902 stop:44711 length:810 start_codon:yes stop_codon:yes gene_type:complete
MIMRRLTLFIAVCGAALTTAAYAQNAVNPDRDKPLEITADESLEWHRNELFFQAKKNVRAVQGATTLLSDVLVAKYRESKKSNMEIYNIQATGSVQIISAKSKAYGDKAVYNVDKGFAVMTGRNLRLVSEDQTVTARDKLQYWVNQGRLEAIGRAVAVREGDRVEADKLIAVFLEGADGKRVLKTLEAIGSVVITTPTEVLTGDRARYEAQTNIAELQDNVRITKGPNVLEGARAQVNLETNISKIFGSKDKDGGRVKGVFYPRSEDKP